MKGIPSSYYLEHVTMQKEMDGVLFRFTAFNEINDVLANITRGMRVHAAGCVVRNFEGQYEVHVKIIANGQHVIVWERWDDFPSDEFRTTLMLLNG